MKQLKLTMNSRFECPACPNDRPGEFIVNNKQGWVVCLCCATKQIIPTENQRYAKLVSVARRIGVKTHFTKLDIERR